MADSLASSTDLQKLNVGNKDSKDCDLKPPQVKFMFGDEDSDSGRSCSLSLTFLNKNDISNSTKVSVSKNILAETILAESSKKNQVSKKPSESGLQRNKSFSTNICFSAGKESSPLEVAKGGLAIAPSPPSTRLDNKNAVGSPIHFASTSVELSSASTLKEKDNVSISKLPATAHFINNHVSSSQLQSSSASQVQSSSNLSRSKEARNTSSVPNLSTPSPKSSEEVLEKVSTSESPVSSHNETRSSSSSTLLSRTQQKLFLQRQDTHTDDVSSLLHPQNQLKFSKELERANREYGWVRRHYNPVLESLQRVMARRRLDTSQQP